MDWFLIALIAPLLWACTNFIDKYLVSKHFSSNTGTLILYSAFIGLPISLLILLFKPNVLSIDLKIAALIVLNGFLYISYLFPYFKALNKADTSVVASIFQTIPVFSYFLAFFILKEQVAPIQLLGSVLIIAGAVGITLKFSNRKLHITKDVLLLQLLSSFIIALNFLLFKFFAKDLDFWTVSFWQYLGFAIFGSIIILVAGSYRRDFIKSFKVNSRKIIGLNALNEVLNITATIIFSFATLLAPLAIVWVVNSVQPLFIFIIGAVLTVFFPKIIKEDLGKRAIIQRVFFILVMALGAYLIR